MPSLHDPALLLTTMLVAAILGGAIARRVRLPRIVGYLVAGTALRQVVVGYGGARSADEMARSLELINDIALGLILFTIGGMFESRRLKATWRSLCRLSAAEILTTFGLTAAGCTVAAAAWPGAGATDCLTVGLLLGAIAIATAPAATFLVLREFEAKGPTTDHLLGMTGLNNLVSILVFNALFLLCAAMGWLDELKVVRGALWIDLLFMSAGSIALGLALGLLLSALHTRLAAEAMLLLLLATILGLWSIQTVGGIAISPLVALLVMGAVFANLALNPSQLEQALGVGSWPIYALFFVLAGFHFHLADLSHMGLLGATYLAMRTMGKVIGVRLGLRGAGPSTGVQPRAGMGMLCQAGVAIGLAQFLKEHWDGDMADTVHVVALASVTVNELVGPVLVKFTVVRAGEVKVATLLRARPRSERPAGRWRLRIGRRLSRGRAAAPPDTLGAAHVMRANVHLLDAGADFDEVLRFVETSRLTDFPVVDAEGHYVGLVQFRNLRDLMYDPGFRPLVTASDLADPSIPAVRGDQTLPDLLRFFNDHGVAAAAVVASESDARLIGVVEERDVLRAMHIERR